MPAFRFPAMGIYVATIGLACAALGLYGVIDSLWFGWGAERASAKIVGFDQSGEGGVAILEFTAAGRSYCVRGRGVHGLQWIGGGTTVLYRQGHPEEARLAGLAPRFAIPLTLLVLGSVFAFAGLRMWRRGWIPT
jgi:hypothetical protein